MEDYLQTIEFAVTSVLEAVWHENDEFESLNRELNQDFKTFFEELDAIQSSAGIVTQLREMQTSEKVWQAVSNHDRRIIPKNEKLEALKGRMAVRELSVAALSGTLLQFAKQGISIVHGGPKNCPDGRSIGTQSLKSIIWHGRNQSLHWEDQPLKPDVRECFRKLSLEFGLSMFGMFQHKNLGFSVVQLLEWRTFDNFKADLLLLNSD